MINDSKHNDCHNKIIMKNDHYSVIFLYYKIESNFSVRKELYVSNY